MWKDIIVVIINDMIYVLFEIYVLSFLMSFLDVCELYKYYDFVILGWIYVSIFG